MAAAAIAAKAAINRKIAKQKKADIAAALAAGLDPEEEFMKRVMARMESEKESQTTKYQDPEQWRGCFKDYVKFANKMQSVSESDSFNLFIIGVIIAAGIVVGFQTYASNDPVYFCASAMPPRLKRCTDATGACVFFSLLLLLLLFAFVFFFFYLITLHVLFQTRLANEAATYFLFCFIFFC